MPSMLWVCFVKFFPGMDWHEACPSLTADEWDVGLYQGTCLVIVSQTIDPHEGRVRILFASVTTLSDME